MKLPGFFYLFIFSKTAQKNIFCAFPLEDNENSRTFAQFLKVCAVYYYFNIFIWTTKRVSLL